MAKKYKAKFITSEEYNIRKNFVTPEVFQQRKAEKAAAEKQRQQQEELQRQQEERRRNAAALHEQQKQIGSKNTDAWKNFSMQAQKDTGATGLGSNLQAYQDKAYVDTHGGVSGGGLQKLEWYKQEPETQQRTQAWKKAAQNDPQAAYMAKAQYDSAGKERKRNSPEEQKRALDQMYHDIWQRQHDVLKDWQVEDTRRQAAQQRRENAALGNDPEKIRQNEIRKFNERKEEKEVYDLVYGNVDKGSWLSGRTEDMKRALDAGTAGSKRTALDRAKQNRAFDDTDDVQLWSTQHRKDMRGMYEKAIPEYQAEIDRLKGEIESSAGKGNRWDALLDLYTTPEIENERTIINGEGYTEEQKEVARQRLAELMNRGGGNAASYSATKRAQNFLKYNERNMTALKDHMNMDMMRRMAYDAMNGSGAYEKITSGMSAAEKQALDDKINQALDYVSDPNGRMGVELRNAQARLKGTQERIAEIDRQDKREQEYKDKFNTQMGDTEWHPQNAEQEAIRNWETAFAAASPDGVVSPSIMASMQTMNVDKLYAALDPTLEYSGDITAYDELTRNAILMNQNERDMFISLYNNGQKNEAWAFFQGLQPMLNQAYGYYEKLYNQELARRLPILSSAMTEMAHITQPVEAITNMPGQLSAWITGEDNAQTDPYSSAYQATRFKTDVREQVAKDLGDWGWVYTGTMSGVDSAFNVAIGRALGLSGTIKFLGKERDALQFGTLALFHTQAFETSLQNTLTQGHDNFGYDMMEAWIDAAIETATEIYSVEAWMAEPKNLLTYVGKIALAEPSEEIVGEIVKPYISEMLGHKNEWKERAQAIFDAGGYEDANGNWVEVKDIDQATRQAMREWNHAIRMAAQEALISVGPSIVYGGGQMYLDTGRLGKSMQRTNVNGEQSAAKALAEAGAKLDTDTYTYELSQKISEKLAAGKKVSNYEIGLLTRNMMEEGNEKAQQKAQKALQDRIYKELEGKDLQGAEEKALDRTEAAELLTKAATEGIENLSEKERNRILNNYDLNEIYKGYAYNDEQIKEVNKELNKATKAERTALSTAQRTMLEAQALEAEAAGEIQLADEQEWMDAEGDEKTGSRRIVYNGKRATLGNLVETTENGKTVLRYQVKVDGQNEPVLAKPADIRATTPGTAGIVYLQSINKGLYSPMYTNRMIAMMDDKRVQNKPDTLMKAAKSIRIAAFTMAEMPQTELPADVAEELYNAAKAEFMMLRQRDVKNRTALKPGEGIVTFKGATFDDGTDGFEKALDGLSDADKQYVRDIAAFGKAMGLQLGIADNSSITDELNKETNPFRNEPQKIYGYESRKGIRVNLEGVDYQGGEEAGRHNIGITLGHETVHWLQRNSMEGYNNLAKYVMDEHRRVLGEKGLQDKIAEVMQQKNCDLDEALSEIVADSCDNIFNNEEVVKHIQETNEKLYKDLRGFAKDLLKKVKNFMRQGRGSDSMSEHSKRLLNREMKQIGRLFNIAYDEAISGKLNVNEKEMKQAKKLYDKYAGSMSEQADIKNSTAEVTNNIKKGMTDKERYEILKGEKILTRNAYGKLSEEEINTFSGLKVTNAYDHFKKITDQLGLTTKSLENKYIKGISAVFSNRSLQESINKQEEGYANLAALMKVFEETYKNAVPVLVQGDRYQNILYDDERVESFIELLGAFTYGEKVIPVKFDLKQYGDKDTQKLYVVATIKKDAIVSAGPQLGESADQASSVKSIQEIIQNVNADDEDLLLIIPEQFLNEDQLSGKRKALTNEGKYIREKAERNLKTRPTNYNVNMTTERIDRVIDQFGADDSVFKAYMAYINPDSFVKLITENRESIENSNHPINGIEMLDNVNTPYIIVDFNNGQVVGYQGIQDMDSMDKAGIKNVAVLIIPDNMTGGTQLNTINKLNIKGVSNTEAQINNLIPVNQEHRQELVDTYSNSDNWFRYSTAQMDEEYEQAVMDKNWTKAEQMLMDKLSQTEGIIPYRAPHGYVQGKVKNHQEIAKQIKEKYGPAIAQAVEDMAPMVPDNAALVPMPPSTGTVTTETDTYVLAQALSEATGRPVIVALDSNERESRYKAKKNDEEGVQVEDMGFRKIEEIPEDMMPVFVDNVVGKGVTAQAAHDAIGRGITLAYAKTTRGNVVKGLKSLTVTYDKKGNLIPLSKRLDINNPSVKYSTADIEPADTDSENFRNWFKNSKVVDEDGRPMIVYHGTEEDFDAFDPSRSRINMDIQGMFFSPWEIEAGGYGSKVGAYYLSIQNPAPEELAYKTLNKYKGQNEAGRKAREDLIRQGYDGVQTYDEYIAFYPGQIKSATDNNGNYDENDERYRFSTFSEEQADVNQWMMNATASTVQTEDERQLLQAYKDLKIKMNLSLKRQLDYQRKIRELENAADRLTPAERDDLIGLRNKLAIQQKKMADWENELFEITSNEGYAKKMYQFNMVYRDFLAGKTADQVRQAVESMLTEVQQAQEQIKKDTEELKKLAQEQAVKSMQSFLGKSSLGEMAAMLRKTFNSSMNKAEIQDRLAAISIKMATKQDVESDIELLTQDLMDKIRGIRSDNMEYIRGTTLVIGQHLVDELKAEHVTLKELRAALKGSGVTLKTAEKGRFVQTWEELRENNQALPEVNNLSESDAIRTIIDYVEGEMRSSRGSQQYNENFDELALLVRSAATNVSTFITGDAAARKQITSLMHQIRDLSAKTEKTAADMDKLNQRMDEVVKAGQRATAHASSLSMDVNSAIEYYSKTAKVAAENERTKVRKQLIEQLRSENTKRLIEQQEEFKKKLEKDRTARQLAQDNLVLRRRITTVAKRMANLITKETDIKNIPEQAKPLARQMLRMLVNHDRSFRMVMFGDRAGLNRIEKVLDILDTRDGKFKDEDLDWLIRGEGENADYDMYDRVITDLINIETGLLEYASAEGKGNVSLMDRKNALTKVQKAVTEIYSVIKHQQEVEIEGRKWNVDTLAMQLRNDMRNSRFKGNRWFGSGAAGARAFVIAGNTTPEYFIKNLHNGTMTYLFGDYHNAENRAGLLYQMAADAMNSFAEEAGFDTWDPDKKFTLTLEKGGTVKLNVEQMMQIYATWKREQTLQAEIGSINKTFHLESEGFYVENDEHKIGQREVFREKSYRMTENDFAVISKALTQEQKEYVDKVVEFLTRTMGAIGNEASMRMYGIKKYNEQYYFPFEVWSGVKSIRSDKGAAGSLESHRGAHPSFSKRLMNNAGNALVMRGFTQTAAKHIVGMINYGTFAPAIENLQKVMNVQVLKGETAEDMTLVNMWTEFGEAYGKDAMNYLLNFQKSINGGTDRNETTPYDRLLSTFRKSAVAGSLSVAFQQPLSYIRAIMEIDPKYLAQALVKQQGMKNTKAIVEEMRKYSGVAVLKKMGKFDMGFGRSAQQFVTPEGMKSKTQKAYDYVSDKATALPELMDTVTWTRLWMAAKLEQQALHKDMDVNSDAFLQMVADRFNEIIRMTQVYDSVMVRSPNMRSTNPWVKGLTSFMAEPTLTMNVLADAVVNAKDSGGKTRLAKACAAYILSAVGQALVKGLMGAGRNPDKKKTWDENAAYRFMYNFIGEINPLGLLPGYSDIITLIKEGELTDDAMNVIGKIFQAGKKGLRLMKGSSENVWRDVEDSVGVVAQLFTNIPVKNLSRDARAMINFFTQPYAQRPNSAGVLKYQTKDLIFSADNLLGALNKLTGDAIYKTTNSAYYDRIYQAEKTGDTKAAEEMKDYVTLTSSAQDPEKNLNDALRSMAKKDADLSGKEKVQAMLDNGGTAQSIKTWITKEYKAKYVAASVDERRQMMNELTAMYKMIGVDGEAAMKIVAGWVKESKKESK